MIFRKATEADLDRISEIYEEIHESEESGLSTIGWIRGVYPSRDTALASIKLETMFVCVDNDKIVAAAKLDNEQVPEYTNVNWQYVVPEDQVMVMHTLVVPPSCGGHSYGKSFVRFYESYAKENMCPYLRIDTNEKNIVARALYKKLGFNEVGIVSCDFNGIPNIRLVCIEKKI